MGGRHTTYSLVPVGVRRRQVLTFLGFRYDWRAGLWQRASLTLSDEMLDAMSAQAFAQRVRHWRRGRG